MPLDFGQHPDVVFKDAPLRSVLCQVRFPPVYPLIDESGIVGFQEGIRSEYPETEREKLAQVSFGQDKVTVNERVPVWRFTSPDGWRVGLAIDFVSLEATQYTSSTDFLDRMDYILDLLTRTVAPGKAKRIGLRKINYLSHPSVDRPSDWQGLLHPSLLGLTAEEKGFPAKFESAFQQFVLREGPTTLAVRHGVIEEEEHPDFLSHYLLDLDCYTEKAHTIEGDGPIRALLTDYASGITSFFHWAITDALYNYLGPRPREETQA